MYPVYCVLLTHLIWQLSAIDLSTRMMILSTSSLYALRTDPHESSTSQLLCESKRLLTWSIADGVHFLPTSICLPVGTTSSSLYAPQAFWRHYHVPLLYLLMDLYTG